MIKFWVNIISLFLLPNFFKIYKPVWEKKKSRACMSIPISQCTPSALPILVSVGSLCLCLCICFANQIKKGHFQSDVSSSDRQILHMENL